MEQPTETNLDRNLDRELWGVVRQASHAMGRARDDELRQAGITTIQSAVLYIVKIVKELVTPVCYRVGFSGSLTQCQRYSTAWRSKALSRK